MGGTERGLVQEGLSEKVALLVSPRGCVGANGCLGQSEQQMTSPDMGRNSVGVLSGVGEG